MVEDAKKEIWKKIKNKIEVSRGLVEQKAVVVDHLGLKRGQVIKQLSSQLGNFCAVSLVSEQKQVGLDPTEAHLVCFDRTLYLVNNHTTAPLQDFLSNPTHYTTTTTPLIPAQESLVTQLVPAT